jgi:NADH/NAD ratio-sensing transcriptional regulator Rex
MKFELINYFDVWGNKKDGYEVNNLCSEGEIELKEDATHKDMIKAMKEHGFLAKHVRSNMIDVWDDGEMVEFYVKRDQRPLCRLELKR